jgi:tetratricopeptide (TPR) repeat protein
LKISLDELGIQYFANGENESALSVFENARKIRQQILSSENHQYAMVLNNLACVKFLMDQPKSALAMFQEAKEIQLRVMKSSSTVGLDLIHVGTTLCNMAYMQLHLKFYDEALSSFQEALLVSTNTHIYSHLVKCCQFLQVSS